jgi:hypothetical protein
MISSQVADERMQSTIRNVMRDTWTWATLLALAAILGAVVKNSAAPSTADANAKTLFKAMSDYMAAQNAISFDYDTYLEVVIKENQKLGLASSGTTTLNHPDKIRATRKGGFADVEMVFDGKTLTMLGKDANAYTQVEAPGTPSTVMLA